MKIRSIVIILLNILLLFVTACNDQSVSPTSTEEESAIRNTVTASQEEPLSDEEAYPVLPEQTNAYPISNEAYPIDESDMPPQGPKFTIDEPVSEDDDIVTGTGPVEVPIRLVDVSAMGKELAMTTIGGDGTYKFELDEPLIAGHLIGLMIGDLADTDFNYDEFIYSDEYVDKPMIGILFSTALVSEDN